jgi:ribosomal protein S18 acetylase RimI-like enzyme
MNANDIPTSTKLTSDEYKDLYDISTFNSGGTTFYFVYMKNNKNRFYIETDDGGEVGYADLNDYDKDFDGVYLDNIRIDPRYRRYGLATAMYSYIERMTGNKIKPSPVKQSDAIKSLWSNKR